MTKPTCALCGSEEATFTSTTNPRGKRFTCPHCTEFWIDEYAESYISGTPEVTRTEMRRNLSRQSQKTAAGNLYVIREPKRSEITGDGHSVARTSLITEWIKV